MKNVFQMHELDAYLGEYVDSYDLDAIVAEVTEIDTHGNRIWRDLDEAEFQAIIEKHDTTK